jgi:hypothetical protein
VIALACVAGAAAFAVRAGAEELVTPPSPREASIFYYPWYSTPVRDGAWAHWYMEEEDQPPLLSTRFYPVRGLYSSSNSKVVDAHMREIAAMGVGTVVVSWWGAGSAEDDRLPLVADAARRHGLQVAIHVEPYPGRTPAGVAADIGLLREQGISDFYVYDADRDPAEAWAEALAGLEGVRLFAHTIFVGRARAAGFDGLYTYDVGTWSGSTFRRLCTQAHDAGLLCAPSVGPGYDARLATSHELVRPRRKGATYDRMWNAALRADADVVSITSYNEWQEGTQIEPAKALPGRPGYDGAWGRRGVAARRAYLHATARWVARLRAFAGQ